ncbi:MAG: hypothetical protein M3N12_06090, partial [Verrucomicrobiota bacterium]|nr:hypothetical protein [Verrucomicrobiota bacterium]
MDDAVPHHEASDQRDDDGLPETQFAFLARANFSSGTPLYNHKFDRRAQVTPPGVRKTGMIQE